MVGGRLLFCIVIFASSFSSICYGELDEVNRPLLGPLSKKNCSQFTIQFASLECTSPWSYCDNGTCKCGDISENILQCHLHRNTSVSIGFCVTYNGTTAITEAGHCIYNPFREKKIVALMSVVPDTTILTQFMCGLFNRTGTLCGKCKDGLYPLAYSFDVTCVDCPNGKSNWWKFVLVALLPNTVFYFAVLLFNINVTSSHLHGFVFLSQIISVPAVARTFLVYVKHFNNVKALKVATKVVGTFYGVWNLDFLRFMDFGICLQTDTLQTLALDLVVGVYPLLLMVVTYFVIKLYDNNFRPLVFLWRPFAAVLRLLHTNWNIRTSLIDAFATFILLSTVKFMSISFDLLVPVQVYQLHPDTGTVTVTYKLFSDATVPYFGERHLPYAVLAISVFLLFVALPAVLLFLYPFRCFQKFLNCFRVHWYILHTFMDSFLGCYKDGTQLGTRDCRWFAFLFFFARIFLMVAGAITLSTIFYPIAIAAIVIIVICLITIQPFKTTLGHYTNINALFLLLLATWFASILGNEHGKVQTYAFLCSAVLVSFVSFLYMTVIVVYWLYRHRKFGWKLVRVYCAWIHGYEIVE